MPEIFHVIYRVPDPDAEDRMLDAGLEPRTIIAPQDSRWMEIIGESAVVFSTRELQNLNPSLAEISAGHPKTKVAVIYVQDGIGKDMRGAANLIASGRVDQVFFPDELKRKGPFYDWLSQLSVEKSAGTGE